MEGMSYDQFQQKVAKKIREARLEAGLTQEDMSDFDMNVRHYQDVEGAKVNVTLETIYRLAKAFKCDPKDLLP